MSMNILEIIHTLMHMKKLVYEIIMNFDDKLDLKSIKEHRKLCFFISYRLRRHIP